MKATVVIPYASHLQAERELAELIPIHPNIPERTQTNNRTHAVASLSTKHITTYWHTHTHTHTHTLLSIRRLAGSGYSGLSWKSNLHQPEVHRYGPDKKRYSVLVVVSYSAGVSAPGVRPACQQMLQSLSPFCGGYDWYGLCLFTFIISALLLSNRRSFLLKFSQIWGIITSKARRAGCKTFSLA